MRRPAAILAALAAVLGAVAGLAVRVRRPRRVANAVIVDPEQHTVLDESGAVRSIQAADLTLPAFQLDRMWNAENLERLARTYWRFLSRVTLGLIRVDYTEAERFVVLLRRPFVLLRFAAPEYEMDPNHGIVRWRIADGVLVSPEGRGGEGYLEIDVSRFPFERGDDTLCHVRVEVANFYPAIASGISTWVYKETQSRIHVLVTHGFLRSLARLDLAESRVGRFVPSVDEVPAPGEGRGGLGPVVEADPARR